ncbi:MAG: hypothetical protein JKP98_03770 [Rhodobacteraceae bacterium]|nr:hypothetical protein [Paracoccaceae bacterium]
MRDGDTPIRAYGLEYSQSAQTGTLLLTRVRQYGRDFEKQSNGPRITGGTQLPSWTFDYRGDHTAFTARTYGGRATASLAYAADINGDKRDELLFPPYRYEEYQTRCTPRGEDCREYLSVPYQSALDYRYSFGIDRSIARTRSGMARSESVRYSRSRGRRVDHSIGGKPDKRLDFLAQALKPGAFIRSTWPRQRKTGTIIKRPSTHLKRESFDQTEAVAQKATHLCGIAIVARLGCWAILIGIRRARSSTGGMHISWTAAG